MNKIEKLTDDQVALMEEVKNEWLGNLKLKLNKKGAKKSIEWLYEFCGLEKPDVVFVDSPLAVQYAVNMMAGKNKNQVWNQVWDQVENQVWNQVENQVWNQVENQVRNQDLTYFSFSAYGSIWDYGWVSFIDFFERVGVKLENKNFTKFKKLLKTGIYDMVQAEKFVVVCGMPDYIKRDEQNNLSSGDASAIKWSDGYELHYLYGVFFDKDLWEKVTKGISAIEVLKLENMEQRMAALKYLGAEKLIKDLQAKKIDSSEKGNELYALQGVVPNKTFKLLKYKCPSTGRIYTKFVPFEMEKADEAQAWSFKVTLKEYYSLVAES